MVSAGAYREKEAGNTAIQGISPSERLRFVFYVGSYSTFVCNKENYDNDSSASSMVLSSPLLEIIYCIA